jgi:3D (Asp-Asp-Asp) domain-containing protein
MHPRRPALGDIERATQYGTAAHQDGGEAATGQRADLFFFTMETAQE